MGKIISVKARQIFDSRGNPTVEVDVFTDKDGFGRAAVPSGASTGQYEAVELRDNNEKFLGKGVMSAVNNVNKLIAKSIIVRTLMVYLNQVKGRVLVCLRFKPYFFH